MIRIKTPMMFVVFMTFIGLNAGGTSVYGQYMDEHEHEHECEWIFSPTDFYEGFEATTSGICSADFNGDGTLDVAIANRKLDNVMVFSNDGSGHYSVLSRVWIGEKSIPRYVVCGDFDGDGDIDAATANWEAHCEHCEPEDPLGYEGGSLTVLLNDGSGVFTVTEEHLLLRASCLDVADLNGDGILDLIVAHWDPEVDGSGPGIATVFRGIGDGTFEEVAYVPVGNKPRGIDVGDLDNDGDIDFAVSNMGSDDSVTVVENVGQNSGDFNFVVRTPLLEGTTPRYLAIGDVTGDGLSDILVVHKVPNTMLVYKNDDDFNFSLFGKYPTDDNPHSIAVADIDGDCSLDVIVSHVGPPPPYFVYLYRNNRSGVFEKTEIESLHGPAHVITADVNDDGKPDVLTACVSGGYFNVHMSEVAQIGCTDACPSDINHDGVVSVEDFLIIISTWGQCESFGCCGDINRDGAVDVTDVLIVVANFGGECDPEERSLAPPQLDDSAPRPRRSR